jgi:predicted dinucleotide-binding enzyme
MTSTENRNLRIAVFGPGRMAGAIAPHWVGPGRELAVSGRRSDAVDKLAGELGATVMPWRQAAEWADVVLLAVHWSGVDEALTQAGADDGTLAGKVLVDCGNAVEVERFTLVDPARSLAQRIRDRTGARVVKAFNLAHFKVWEHVPDYDGRPFTVPIAGDDEEAKALVSGLIADVGATAVDTGDLDHATYLEAMAVVIIRILFSGADPTTVFNLVDHAHSGGGAA